MFEYAKKKHAKFTVLFLIILFIGIQIGGTFFFARQTKAIVGAPDVVAALTAKWSTDSLVDSLLSAGMSALVNASAYFMRKLAYDSAKYISSAAKGEKPLVYQEGAGEYFKNVGLDSAAGAIDQFGKGLFGTGLCQPPDLRVQAYIQIGLRQIYGDPSNPDSGPKPSCTWSEFTKNWEEGADNGFGNSSPSEMLANSLRVDQTDFGIAVGLDAQVGRQVVNAKAGAGSDRLEGEGYKSLTGLISGKTKTPAQLIKLESESVSAKQQGQLTTQMNAGLFGSGMLQSITSGMSVFLNTLVGDLLQHLLTGGFFPDGSDDEAAADQVTNPFSAVLNVNRAAAEKAFSYLVTAVPTELSEFDIVNTYVSCPDNGKNAGLNNCVMDDGLRQAIQRARSGEAMTIQEAMDAGYLDPQRQLISPLREADNTDEAKCWTEAYCYSNLQKLRRVRILPLGFELAALKSDPDNPWKLIDVVKGFEECNFNENGVAIPDPKFPFCHLIDPNWVIKAPAAQCEAIVKGPELVNTDTAQRREECADISTCLATDENGRCIDYGYCTREENVWNIGGESCEREFATCTTYVNTKTNAATSYLSRTLDYGECNQQSIGCRAYSVNKIVSSVTSSSWISSALYNINPNGVSNAIKQGGRFTTYFNDTISGETCPADATGCSAFYPAAADGSKDTSAKPVYLKEAPNYLGCYDVDVNQTGVQWPQKESDFAELEKRPEQCANFASACMPAEVGCRAYDPVDGNIPSLTGVIGANACDASCVGYDAFKQEKSAFESEQFPLYFIPTQGDSCNAQFEGCSEFTNIESAADGGEQKEYYKSINYCERPTGSNERVFYTWEGSPNQGYVLRIHRKLKVSTEQASYVGQLSQLDADISVEEFYPAGSPAYVDDTTSKLNDNFEKCNEENYNLYIQNPDDPNAADDDCRAMYDETGTPYYRLLAETVTVDASCHAVRATESFLEEDTELTQLTAGGSTVGNQNLCNYKGGLYADDPGDDKGNTPVCRRCLSGGVYQDGACVYKTISQQGAPGSCPAAANLCRAFTGNAGNNVQEVMLKTFEPVNEEADSLAFAQEGWSTGKIAADSVHVGQHSLQVESQAATYTFATSTIKADGWYELSFWARGTPQSVVVEFRQDVNGGTDYNNIMGSFTKDYKNTQTDVPVSIGQEWREYSLGPVQFIGDATKTVVLRFTSVGQNQNDPYFIDNVRLVRHDKFHLIRDSWKVDNNGNDVPLACDATPNDGIPGAALGCRQYQDIAAATPVYATGFERICRPQAAGCQTVYDTNNTVGTADEALTQIFNARCTGTAGETCQLTSGGEVVGECEVGINQTECYIAEKIVLDDTVTIDQDDWASQSTVVIPGDPATPVYLTNRLEYRCASRYLGCSDVALEERVLPDPMQSSSYTYSETRVLNNPQKYNETLCRVDLMGCSEYKAGSNLVYFKDPNLIGSTLCEYNSQPNQSGQTGWFMKDVGVCMVDLKKVPPGQPITIGSGRLCKSDDQCGIYEACVDKGEQACSPDYLNPGGEFGLWSNESDNYKGFVGMCPQEENGCTELVDRADNNKQHYVIFDDVLARKAGECSGASLKEGCVLFDRVDSPNKLFNTNATYDSSKQANNALVQPISNTGNDANVLLKVERDRQCSEWLACRTSVSIRNANNEPIELCYEYKACRARAADGSCAEWVDEDENAGQRLTEQAYVSRSTDWNADEYVGYSLLNRYPVNNYVYVQFDSDVQPDLLKEYLAYRVPNSVLQEAGYQLCGGSGMDDGAICGGGGGRCFNDACIYPIDGQFSSDVNSVAGIAAELDYGICKSYPEKDSPYIPGYVLRDGVSTDADQKKFGDLFRNEFVQRKQPYQNANVMQGGVSSCEYQKVEYKDGTVDYWPQDKLSTDIPVGVCSTGDKVDSPCGNDSDCGTGGSCSRLDRLGVFYGQRGYCLEFDRSRPLGKVNINGSLQDTYACLTWLPIQTSASTVDLYNADEAAGYYPPLDAKITINQKTQTGGELYCTNATDSGLSSLSNGPINLSTIESEFNSLFNSLNGRYKGNEIMGLSGTQPRFHLPTTAGTFMQAWAYKMLGANAILLRAELNGTVDQGAGMDWANVYPSCTIEGHPFFGEPNTANGGTLPYINSCVKLTEENQNGTAPARHVVYSFGGFAPPTRYTPTWGTQVHGPRDWSGQENNQVGFIINLEGAKDFSIQATSAPTYEDRASMAHMSPGPSIIHGVWNQVKDVPNAGVFRSRYEAELNEYDLNEVYFVPTLFPGDANGFNPELLSREFKIKFNGLREKETNKAAYLESVDSSNSPNSVITGSIDQGGLLWVYKLEDNTAGGLLSHFDYNAMLSKEALKAQPVSIGTGYNTPIEYLASLERNKIHRRYVAVMAQYPKQGACDGMPQFLTDAGLGSCANTPKLGTFEESGIKPPTPQNNPLTAPCPDDTTKYNYIAIGMDFNKDGEFLGYVSKYCHSQNGRGGINFATVAVLNNVCTEFTQVYEPSQKLIGTTNKAWTQRIWEQSSYQHEDYGGLLKRPQPTPPFGSLKIGASDLTNSLKLRKYSFIDKDTDGIPYACRGAFGPSTDRILGADTGNCDALLAFEEDDNYNSGLVSQISGKTEVQARTALQKLFALSFSRKIYAGVDQNGLKYTSQGKEDKANVGARPPRIFSINPFTCIPGSGRECTAAEENNITIGRRNYTATDYDGDGSADEDKNADGIIDPIIAKGYYTAIVNFFAYADDNQMSIRRVMVDWDFGKSITNAGKMGMYKNRKPFCEFESKEPKHCLGANAADTGLTCRETADCTTALGTGYVCEVLDEGFSKFGDLSRACQPGYFEFTHQYTCSGEDLSDTDIARTVGSLDPAIVERLKLQNLSEEDEVCVYVPKVQVLDNWGWCNGTCNGVNGCYNDKKVGTAPIYECAPTNQLGSSNPWTRYKGQIIVIPSET